VTGHVRVARTGFSSSLPVARPVLALPGTSQMKGTRFRGQIRSESPDTTGPDPGGSPPKTAVTTHSQIRRSRLHVRNDLLRAPSRVVLRPKHRRRSLTWVTSAGVVFDPVSA
jgi:hypothetical protein